ncbi:arrestin domain-containing protein 4 [Protopterus annectens]|uniref:arrestin domain-containing protein 4 n=1 Tax=Protopterus annectens TaxID=7888 RepID=UPI001CFA148E|nr:arrestin domain-containing protein 4 [Protopterus annectens]
MKTFAIYLDSEEKQGYSTGDIVSGVVLFENLETLWVRTLLLKVHGQASMSWGGCGPSATAPFPVSSDSTFSEEVEYYQHRQILLSPPYNAGEENLVALQPGKHEFPFRFQLPPRTLPSSFVGKYGRIQYWINAVLERSNNKQTVKRELPVISHIDVGSPALLSPVSRSKEQTVGCWLLTTGPISLSAKIERRGYCNGEAIPIYAEIENCSSRLIVPKAAIFQVQTYLANGKTKIFRQMIANVRGSHIASGRSDSWNGKMLKIPPTIPSILDCSIIKVEYLLAVYVHIPGAKKLVVELPLVMGTIPCNGLGSRTSSACSHLSMDMSWLAQTLPEHPEAPPNYADVVTEEEFSSYLPSCPQPAVWGQQFGGHIVAYIQECRFQPPPLYSESDLYPPSTEERRHVSFMI